MRRLTTLFTLMLLLTFVVSAAHAQDDPETSPIELTPNLCDDPSNVAAVMGSMGDSGDGPSYGEVNTEQIMRMMQAPTEGPFYMVNLIAYREQAEYPDGRETELTGREANNLYSPLEFIQAIGAQPVFTGEVTSNVLGEDSIWDDVAIVEYPCPLAVFAMGAHPEFQATSIHKDAGLEASNIMVTHVRPFDAFDLPEVAADDTAFELVQVVRYNEEAQYADGSDEPFRIGQEAMDFYAASILEAGLSYGVYPKARLEVEGVYIGDGQDWDEVWVYYAPSQEAFDAFMADPVVVAAQYHRDAAVDNAYELVTDPTVSMIHTAYSREASAQEDLCNAEPEAMTTANGVEFVRTPDACFDNLPDWDYEPQYVEINGLRQAYYEAGPTDAEETILLLHGQPAWSYTYRDMMPIFAEAGHRAIAMDFLGMGRSDKPIDPAYYTYAGHVERLEVFITELGLDETSLTVFVQDWGSLIGLQVVGTNPGWFDRVVVGNGSLYDIPAGMDLFTLPDNPEQTRDMYHMQFSNMPDQQPYLRDENGILQIPGQQADAGQQSEAAAMAMAQAQFGIWVDYALNDERFLPSNNMEANTFVDLTDEEEVAYNAPFPTRITMGGVRAFPGLSNEMAGVTTLGWEGLGEFESPFLTIWGNNDPDTTGSVEEQQALMDHVPGSAGWDHTRLRDASHYLTDDAGEEIAQRINAFITPGSEANSAANETTAAEVMEQSVRLGFEIIQVVSPTGRVAWRIESDMTLDEFNALELPTGWIKNQPRELDFDAGVFTQSPGMSAGEYTDAEHFGYEWRHVATVSGETVQLDAEGILTASPTTKSHQLTWDEGSTIYLLVSPEGERYIRVNRDFNRSSDTFTIPTGWQLVDATIPQDLTFELPNPTLVFRTDNGDSFQGPFNPTGNPGQPPAQAAPQGTALTDHTIPTVEQTQFLRPPDDFRGFRFCEVIVTAETESDVVVSVYNTMGHSDCPPEQWGQLDANVIAEGYGVSSVELYGPRYWLLNDIIEEGASGGGQIADFGGMELRLSGQLTFDTSETGTETTQPYIPNDIRRNTIFVYQAGNTVYELTSPDGVVYRMHETGEAVLDNLQTLSERLDLPNGWTYATRTLERDEPMVAVDGVAHILQDNLGNVYQQIESMEATAESADAQPIGLVDDAIPAVQQTQFMRPPADLRGFPYCEMLAMVQDEAGVTVTVYNTMGHSDCPAEQWNSLDADAIAEEYDLMQAQLNGPRYWLMNGIRSDGVSSGGQVSVFGGMEMRLSGVVTLALSDLMAASTPPYTESQIARDTTYIYRAGNEVYELVSPEGGVYRMQSYLLKGGDVSFDDLDTLGERLTLPDGWIFQTRVLTEDETIVAVGGTATILRDDLENTYQLLEGAAAATQDTGNTVVGIESITIEVGEFTFNGLASGPENGDLVLLLHGFTTQCRAGRHED
jgi:pimeloyl-ACP methyl ester carboxylesterase